MHAAMWRSGGRTIDRERADEEHLPSTEVIKVQIIKQISTR